MNGEQRQRAIDHMRKQVGAYDSLVMGAEESGDWHRATAMAETRDELRAELAKLSEPTVLVREWADQLVDLLTEFPVEYFDGQYHLTDQQRTDLSEVVSRNAVITDVAQLLTSLNVCGAVDE